MSAKTKILVVDDSKLMRKAVRNIFEDSNDIEVIGEAANGSEALELIPEIVPDVIVLDVNMPIMDGVKLVSMVRNDPNYKETPIIVITTEGVSEYR